MLTVADATRLFKTVTDALVGLPTSLGQKTAANSLPVTIANDQSVVPVTPAATESHLGEVGGWSDIITPTLAVTAAAYSANNCVGGKLTLSNAVRTSGGTGILQSVFLVDRANQKPALDILIFDSDPAATFTDKAAFPTLTLADSLKVIRRVSIGTGDWTTIGGHAYATVPAISKVLKANGTRNLFAAMATPSTPTFAATTDLIVRFGILGN